MIRPNKSFKAFCDVPPIQPVFPGARDRSLAAASSLPESRLKMFGLRQIP
jgi:hypothetical protein